MIGIMDSVKVGDRREVVACSIRTDYSADTLVREIAVGLCRVASIAGET